MTIAAFGQRHLSGRHVLLVLLALFGAMALANGLLVFYAISTFGGVDTEDAYRRGLDYDAVLDQAQAQIALGWQSRLAPAPDGRTLELDISDGGGHPVAGLAVSGRLYRPATDRFDARIGPFTEPAAGHYRVVLPPLAPGMWIVDLEARGRTPYRIRERLWLSPPS